MIEIRSAFFSGGHPWGLNPRHLLLWGCLKFVFYGLGFIQAIRRFLSLRSFLRPHFFQFWARPKLIFIKIVHIQLVISKFGICSIYGFVVCVHTVLLPKVFKCAEGKEKYVKNRECIKIACKLLLSCSLGSSGILKVCMTKKENNVYNLKTLLI